MIMTSKGQVTIPRALRERFGLLPGTEVEFVAASDGLRLMPRQSGKAKASAFASWLTKAEGSASFLRSTDAVLAETRGDG